MEYASVIQYNNENSLSSVKAALDQIKDRKYPESVACYAGELLLVGINYNEKTKKHECWIEKYEKC